MAMTERAEAYVASYTNHERRMRLLENRSVQKKADAHRGDVVKLSLAVMAVLVYLFSITFLEAKITSAGTEINNLQTQIVETQNLSARTDLRIGELAGLERIESYAVEKLGMVYPDYNSTYILDEASSIAIAAAMGGSAAADARRGMETASAAEERQTPAETEPNALWDALNTSLQNFFYGSTAFAASN